jgi:hypothetical protein
MFITSYKEFYRGLTAHIPRNFLLSMSNIFLIIITQTYSGIQLLFICKFVNIRSAKPILPYYGISNINSATPIGMLINSESWHVAP